MLGKEGNFEKNDFSCDDHGPIAITTISASMKSLFTETPKPEIKETTELLSGMLKPVI